MFHCGLLGKYLKRATPFSLVGILRTVPWIDLK